MGEKGIRLSLATCRTITCGFLTAGTDKAEELLEIMVRFGWVLESTVLYDLVDQNQADVNSEGTFRNQTEVEFEDAAEHVIELYRELIARAIPDYEESNCCSFVLVHGSPLLGKKEHP